MPPTVYVCVLTRDGKVAQNVRRALDAAIQQAEAAGIRSVSAVLTSPYGVAHGRNSAVAHFLTSKCSHLLFVDDDVTVPPDAIPRLTAIGGDIALGCYAGYKKFNDGTVGFFVVVMYLGRSVEDCYRTWPAGVEEVEGGGAGCMLIARPVLEKLTHPWFRWSATHIPGTPHLVTIGEDIDFCLRARGAGFRIWADGGVRCGHWKEIDLAQFVKESG